MASRVCAERVGLFSSFLSTRLADAPRKPFNQKPLITHLTNSNGCGILFFEAEEDRESEVPCPPILAVSPTTLLPSQAARILSLSVLAARHATQFPPFHTLADSLSLPKNSTPLQSSKSELFPQNTRGVPLRHRALCGSALSFSVEFAQFGCAHKYL